MLATAPPTSATTVDPRGPAPDQAPGPAGPHTWPGWPALLADVLTAPGNAFRPLAAHPGLLVPLAALATAKFVGLFAHFAPSLAPARLAVTITAQGVLALLTAAAWAAAVWAVLACTGARPRYQAVVALFLTAAFWPEVLWALSESAVAAVGAYPDTFDPRVHRVTSLLWLAPAGPAPALRALANAADAPTLYRDVLLATGLPQAAPGVSRRTAAVLVATLALARTALAVVTA